MEKNYSHEVINGNHYIVHNYPISDKTVTSTSSGSSLGNGLVGINMPTYRKSALTGKVFAPIPKKPSTTQNRVERDCIRYIEEYIDTIYKLLRAKNGKLINISYVDKYFVKIEHLFIECIASFFSIRKILNTEEVVSFKKLISMYKDYKKMGATDFIIKNRDDKFLSRKTTKTKVQLIDKKNITSSLYETIQAIVAREYSAVSPIEESTVDKLGFS